MLRRVHLATVWFAPANRAHNGDLRLPITPAAMKSSTQSRNAEALYPIIRREKAYAVIWLPDCREDDRYRALRPRPARPAPQHESRLRRSAPMPALRQREQTLRAELQAIADQANDRANFLRLAETLTAFLARLRSAADTLDVTERQRIVRLVIKEILVGDDTIIIRHCIPVASGPRPNDGSTPTPGRTESASRPKLPFV